MSGSKKTYRNLSPEEKDVLAWWIAITTFFSMTSEWIRFATNDDCGDSKYYYKDVPEHYASIRGAGKDYSKACSHDSRGYAADMDDNFGDSIGTSVRNLSEIRPYVDALLFGKAVPKTSEFVANASRAIWNFEKSVPRKFDGDFSECFLEFEKAGQALLRDAGFGKAVYDSYFGERSPVSDVFEELVEGPWFKYAFTGEDWNAKKWLGESGLLKTVGKVG